MLFHMRGRTALDVRRSVLYNNRGMRTGQKGRNTVGTGWQRTWVRILMTALTAAMMLLIFLFSMEPAEKSDHTSGLISRKIIGMRYPDFDRKPPEEQQRIYDSVQHVVRKTAHFTEYMLLGLLIRLCLESWFGKRRGLFPAAWALGTLYAGTDELHQLLIDGRSGQWTDVLIDSGGVLAGAAAAALVVYLLNLRKRNRIRKET